MKDDVFVSKILSCPSGPLLINFSNKPRLLDSVRINSAFLSFLSYPVKNQSSMHIDFRDVKFIPRHREIFIKIQNGHSCDQIIF